MNIQNPELVNRLARFPKLFAICPSITKNGQLIPVGFSRGVLLDYAILRLMAKEFRRMIEWENIDVIAGIDLQGVSLATAIALEVEKPMVIVREKVKRIGRTHVIGDVNFICGGERILLVDDLLAYGGTKETCIKILEEYGTRVTDLAVFIKANITAPREAVNKEETYDLLALRWLQDKGVRVHALIEYEELIDLQTKAGTIARDFSEDILQHNSDGPYWEDTDHLRLLYDYMKRDGIKIPDFLFEFMKSHGVKL